MAEVPGTATPVPVVLMAEFGSEGAGVSQKGLTVFNSGKMGPALMSVSDCSLLCLPLCDFLARGGRTLAKPPLTDSLRLVLV